MLQTLQDDKHHPCAAWTDANVLRQGAPLSPDVPVIMWSGWLSDDPWERDPRAWLPSSYDALSTTLRAARERLEHTNTRLLLRPHARHVLNDPQRCARYLADFAGSGGAKDRAATFGLALDPVSMLEPAMLEKAEDHLERIMERLAPLTDHLILPAHGIALAPSPADPDDSHVTFAKIPEDAAISTEVVARAVLPWVAGKHVISMT